MTTRVILTVLSVLGLAAVPPVHGWGSGAPDPTTCVTMSPSHAGKQGSSTAYAVHATADVYSPGKPITVTLTATKPFKGFSIQARSGNGEEPVGTFTPIDGSKSICQSSKGNGITHSNSAVKSGISFEWTPPNENLGQLTFKATFVECYQCDWFKTESVPIYPFGEEPIGPNENKNREVDSGKRLPDVDNSNDLDYSGTQRPHVTHISHLVSALLVFIVTAWLF